MPKQEQKQSSNAKELLDVGIIQGSYAWFGCTITVKPFKVDCEKETDRQSEAKVGGRAVSNERKFISGPNKRPQRASSIKANKGMLSLILFLTCGLPSDIRR